jgi:hypothetical protein
MTDRDHERPSAPWPAAEGYAHHVILEAEAEAFHCQFALDEIEAGQTARDVDILSDIAVGSGVMPIREWVRAKVQAVGRSGWRAAVPALR